MDERYYNRDAFLIEDGTFGWGPKDINGKNVKKTKYSHPYSYDEFVVWRGGKNDTWDEAAYSDRLQQWDWKKYEELAKEAKRDLYKDPKVTQNFLRKYYSDPKLKLILIMEGCNASNGYPYWIVFWKWGKEKKKEIKNAR